LGFTVAWPVRPAADEEDYPDRKSLTSVFGALREARGTNTRGESGKYPEAGEEKRGLNAREE